MQGLGGEPSGVFVLQELQVAGNDSAQDAVHGKVKSGVIVLDCVEDAFSPDNGSKFFTDFPDDAGFGSFAWFKFAAGDFPPVFAFAVAALGGKDFFFIGGWICAEDDGSADIYLFHVMQTPGN